MIIKVEGEINISIKENTEARRKRAEKEDGTVLYSPAPTDDKPITIICDGVIFKLTRK